MIKENQYGKYSYNVRIESDRYIRSIGDTESLRRNCVQSLS